MSNIEDNPNFYMDIEVEDMTGKAYSNFVDSINNSGTKINYLLNLSKFLEKIPDEFFIKYLGEKPRSHNVEGVTESFVNLAKKDISLAKAAIKSYAKHLKELQEKGEINPNTVLNKIKPIKALLVANEIDISMKLINKMLPRKTQSQDRAYTKEEIRDMLEQCSSVTDKVIILMASSGGFRVGAWDYFCWKDITFFTDKSETYKGAAVCVYRGDLEQYWTFITPEACRMLELQKRMEKEISQLSKT